MLNDDILENSRNSLEMMSYSWVSKVDIRVTRIDPHVHNQTVDRAEKKGRNINLICYPWPLPRYTGMRLLMVPEATGLLMEQKYKGRILSDEGTIRISDL